MNSTALQVNADRIADDRRHAEEWFCKFLFLKYQVDVRAGITTPAQRAAAIVKLIREKDAADQILGRYNDRPESFRQFCKRALGIDLGGSQKDIHGYPI